MGEQEQALRVNAWTHWTFRGLLELGGSSWPRELGQHDARARGWP